VLLALCLSLAPQAGRAAGPVPLRSAEKDPRAPLLVTPAWLKAHLKDPNLVLLHVGDAKEYPAGHIPGARPVSMKDVSLEHDLAGLMLELPPPEALRQKLLSLGVTDGARIVLYWGTEWVSPTTRIFLTLHWAGLGANTSILDGGMPAWVKEGGATTTEATPEAKGGALAPLKLKEFVADAAYVQGALGKPGVSVVDGRAAVYYDGVETGGGGPHAKHKTGHIAGAKSIPFTELHDARNLLKPAAELAALFTKAGVGPGDTVIGYCHIGQQTTAMLTAALSLGHPILLYDGSFQDWSQRDLPIEAKAPPAKATP
jgi:thiosulfate/3-mercaptopyruvate sulfurtransferase